MPVKNTPDGCIFNRQPADKPGFVVGDHLSSHAIASTIKRVSTGERIALLLPISLQLTGFTFFTCHHMTLWALTPLISPLPRVIRRASLSRNLAGTLYEAVLFLWHFP